MHITTTPSPKRYEAPCGAVAASDHMGAPNTLYAFALTPCCKAAGKGSAESPTGVACKACYKPVAASYGGSGWEALHQAAKDAKCPCAAECADHMLHKVLDISW